ncbi:hypothetical protein OPV22_027388 [Ensete ventricosum]|uniref:AtPDCT1/2 transmembrane domain-containing protein n=1 Tax=Ensete ventricosum TaxID=4639 RepID=A0AAV8P450_ENSVE|nr:hypothetical protein OPV22_027388 [Ensete ventricosum]
MCSQSAQAVHVRRPPTSLLADPTTFSMSLSSVPTSASFPLLRRQSHYRCIHSLPKSLQCLLAVYCKPSCYAFVLNKSSGGRVLPCLARRPERTMTAEQGGSATHLRVQRKAADKTWVTLDGVACRSDQRDEDRRHENNHLDYSRTDRRRQPLSYGGGKRKEAPPAPLLPPQGPAFAGWSLGDVAGVARHHYVPCAFALSLLLFMAIEYTIPMVPSTSLPLDIGFILTESLHSVLATNLALNTVLAALNTVFVGMQTLYILWTFVVEGRPRPTIAALFMFTCRGILGSSTQLPLPHGFLGSGVDFPVGNVSFFLFFSGHVAGAVIASLDMRRTRRRGMARAFDALNLLQSVRLLASRGHYTIDLAVGVGAGFVFDVLAGKYEESRMKPAGDHHRRACCSCSCSCSSG